MLSVEELAVHFGTVRAVDGVTLELGPDEVVAVLGPSGSGKTTLLRAIAGLEQPDAGTIAWNGADLEAVPAHRRRFGLLFQDFALFPHLDVAGNVGFSLRLRRMAGRDAADRVSAALHAVGLDGFHDRDIGELSGGQQQRVALARTLVAEPRLLLLDEPLGSLDPALRRDLAADLGATLAATSIPALVVTHDTDEAFALAGRVAIMDAGRFVRTGTPAEIWRNPRVRVAAELVGHGVVLRGEIPALWASAAPDAQALAVPPDALDLDPSGPLSGRVLSVSFRGPDYSVAVEIEGVALSARSLRPPVEEKVTVAFDPDLISPLTG